MNIYGMNFLIVEGNAANCSFMRMHGISDRHFKSKNKAGKVAQCLESEFGPQNPHFLLKSQPWACHPSTVKADLGGSLASQTSVLKRPRPAGDSVWNRQGKGSWRGMTSETVLWPMYRHKHTQAWGPSWRTKARSREQISQRLSKCP